MTHRILFGMTVFLILVFELTAQENPIEWVKIGNQIWMKKNLDVDHFQNGDTIPQIQIGEEWEEACKKGQPAWCYLVDEKYGKLYNWYAVADPRGLAPNGWHIPSEDEFKTLMKNFNKDKNIAYRSLLEKGSDRFNGLLGGYYYYFPRVHSAAFWTSSKSTWYKTVTVLFLKSDCCEAFLYKEPFNAELKKAGFYVRCRSYSRPID